MNNRKIKFAILGCGRISQAHFDAIENAPNAELAAVCDIVEEKAKAAAKKNGLQIWYTDLEKMLKNEEIDVVNICTPSGMHCDNVVVAAGYGKNILCEKPLDITKEKVDLMIKTCRDKGVLLGGIFQRRASSAANYTRDIVKEGTLGRIVLADASLKYYRSQEYYDSDSWRGTWEFDGGGALMNQGIHGIDMLQWMAGDIESVTAKCSTLARDIEVEDTAVIIVKFKHKGLGIIEGSTAVNPGQDTIFSVQGDKGTISFGDKGFYIWKVDGQEEPPKITENLGGLNCGWSLDYSGHTYQIEDMAEAILNGEEPMIPGEEARKAVDIILAIYESSRTGKEVTV